MCICFLWKIGSPFPGVPSKTGKGLPSPRPPPPPEWGVDIKCGKGTNFSYGPWADRQRELLYKFFFPPDYHDMEATADPKPGDVRTPAVFRIRLSTETGQTEKSTLDVLFSKNKETKAVHLNFGQGTNFEIKVPWVYGKSGYATNISGTLMMLESTTSLDYRFVKHFTTHFFTSF